MLGCTRQKVAELAVPKSTVHDLEWIADMGYCSLLGYVNFEVFPHCLPICDEYLLEFGVVKQELGLIGKCSEKTSK